MRPTVVPHSSLEFDHHHLDAIRQKKQSQKGMKHSTSQTSLRRLSTMKTTQLTKQLVLKASDISSYFSVFLANSKGKDKFLSLFQYIFQFVCTCGKNSNIVENALAYKSRQMLDMVIYYNLKENISQARKVFRLLRFLDQIKGMRKILKTNKPWLFKALSVITYFFSISYYISDNTLWFLNVLVASKAIPKSFRRSWKSRKNFNSLFRVIFYLVILFYSIWLQKGENSVLEKAFENIANYDDQFDSRKIKIVKALLDGRRKLRFLYLQLCLSLTRVFMLISSLKLRGYQYLDPIFVGWCGVASSIMGFLKAFYEKRIVLNLDKKVMMTKLVNSKPSQMPKNRTIKRCLQCLDRNEQESKGQSRKQFINLRVPAGLERFAQLTFHLLINSFVIYFFSIFTIILKV